MDDYFDDGFTQDKLIKTISNGEDSVRIYEKENGDVYSTDGDFHSNSHNDDFQDELDTYEEEWREVNWNTSDWADYYGCNESDVQDCMDDDMKDW